MLESAISVNKMECESAIRVNHIGHSLAVCNLVFSSSLSKMGCGVAVYKMAIARGVTTMGRDRATSVFIIVHEINCDLGVYKLKLTSSVPNMDRDSRATRWRSPSA